MATSVMAFALCLSSSSSSDNAQLLLFSTALVHRHCISVRLFIRDTRNEVKLGVERGGVGATSMPSILPPWRSRQRVSTWTE
jgi:hypothetical protein